MISLTAEAAKQIKEAAKQGQMDGMPLRVAAKREADGSINYAMGFADEQFDDDISHVSESVTVVVPPASAELLEECTIDFVEIEPGQFNFIFLNPKDPNYQPPSEPGSGEHHL